MSKTELSSNKLYVVRPSIVVFDDTKYSFRKTLDRSIFLTMPISRNESRQAKKVGVELQPTGILSNINWHIQRALFERAKEKNVNNLTYTVKFENRPQDITIATEETGIYRDVVTDENFYSGIGFHLCEGEKCVNVYDNDRISLARYLWERNVQESKYSYEIEKYVFSLKPFYTMEEIMAILEQLKSEVVSKEEKPVSFTLKRKTRQPIFSRNIYTDVC